MIIVCITVAFIKIIYIRSVELLTAVWNHKHFKTTRGNVLLQLGWRHNFTDMAWFVGWLFWVNVALAILQPYRDLQAIFEIVAATPGIEPLTSCSASPELTYYITAAP